MKVEFDPSFLDAMMRVWRNSVDMKVPMADEFKIHFMSQRRGILGNFQRTATAWGMMLSAMQAIDNEPELAKTVASVNEFKEWADSELAKLDDLHDDAAGTAE